MMVSQKTTTTILLLMIFTKLSASCPDLQRVGGVNAEIKVLTRIQGVSPETVYFSAQNSTDPSCLDYSGGNDMEACRTGQYLGFYFDFDDPESGVFSTTENSKNIQVSGSPRAAHTFTCEGEGNSKWNAQTQQCEYAVKVRVENPHGEWADACVPIAIIPQDLVYDLSQTYCISSNSDFSACPPGVPKSNQLQNTPSPNLAINRSNSRILYQRGSAGVYNPICLRYDEHNVTVDSYGEGSFPIISSLNMGTAQGCNDHIPSAFQLSQYPQLSKDSDGYLNSGWHFGNTVTNLKVGEINVGMSATLLTLHNLDLDWSKGGGFNGQVSLNSAGWNCYNNEELDCQLVPYPFGLFLSEIYSHGNVHENMLPGTNFGCFNDCGMINSAFLGVFGKASFGHNLRIMGPWGLVISNSHLAGDNLGTNGPKSKITLRQIQTDTFASEHVNPENFVDGNHDGNGPGWQRSALTNQHFSPHYNFLVDNNVGDSDQQIDSEEANWVGIHPGSQYTSLFGTQFLTWPDSDPNTSQLALGGRNITTHETSFNSINVNCRFRQRIYADGSFYFDSSLIFSDSPDGACNGGIRVLPQPGPPGVYSDLIFNDGFEFP